MKKVSLFTDIIESRPLQQVCGSWHNGFKAYSCSDDCGNTEKYWIPVYNVLESSCKIVLAHPRYGKAVRGKKTDEKDTKWIVDIFKHDLVAESFISQLDIRQRRV